jgi:hypothetical protein
VPFGPNFRNLTFGEPSSGFTSGPRSASTEEEKAKKDPRTPPAIHTLGPDEEMDGNISTPPLRQQTEQQNLAALPSPVFSPRSRMLFVIADLAISQEKGNLANANPNPFAGNSGEKLNSATQQKRSEDPEEGWTFQGKKKKLGVLARIHSPRQDLVQTPELPPQPTSTPGGKRG